MKRIKEDSWRGAEKCKEDILQLKENHEKNVLNTEKFQEETRLGEEIESLKAQGSTDVET